MKYLIIGSRGFIGRHCLKYFNTKKNIEVWECDVIVDYTAQKYFQVDASNADYSDIFQQEKFDVCINCSGAASVPDSLVHPYRDFLLNTANIFKILEAIRKYSPDCKFLNLSSAAVYGNPEKLPVTESHKCSPVSPYGLHKKQAEEICEEFSRYFSLRTCSARIFSAYGPGLKKQLFWDLYRKASNENEEILLFGTGNETRDFIYIDDLISALDYIIKYSNFNGDVINIGSGIETSIKHVASYFLNEFKAEKFIKFNNEQKKGDPLNWKADISKLNSFGFSASYTIEEGIYTYIKWLKEEVE